MKEPDQLSFPEPDLALFPNFYGAPEEDANEEPETDTPTPLAIAAPELEAEIAALVAEVDDESEPEKEPEEERDISIPGDDIDGFVDALPEADLDRLAELLLTETDDPIWPPEFAEDTPEAAWAFVQECWTWDEAGKKERRMATYGAVRKAVYAWHRTRESGQILIVEKSRRLVFSWLFCILDVWDAGLGKCNIVQGGKTDAKAEDFVWRCWYVYDRLRAYHSDWSLPPIMFWGNTKAERLTRVALANGSIIEPLNSDAEAFRGSGYTRVKLEELSSYRNVGPVISQAKAVTMGVAGERGGHIVAICNSAVAKQWKELKKPKVPIPSVKDAPYLEYESLTGCLVVRVHYSCDPSKTSEWADKERTGWLPSEWRREMELHDEEAAGALWKQATIDSTRVAELPANITRIVVGVDPSVSDPERIKDPTKGPDECGIIAVAITADYHGYVIEDASAVYSPEEWAIATANTYNKHHAGEVVAEGNQGGELVRLNIRAMDPMIPVTIVHARIGKRARAEPIAHLYSIGRMHHVGEFPELESEMTTWDPMAPKVSPAHIDSLTWAATALFHEMVMGDKVLSTDRSEQEDEESFEFMSEEELQSQYKDPWTLMKEARAQHERELAELGL